MKVKPLLESIDTANFLSQYLQALGIEDVDKYLNVVLDVMDNPWDYPNMKEGVERLKKAIDDGEKIGILIDPDVDGNLSAALIVKFLLHFTNNLVYFFHTGKGHGLVQNNEEDIVQQAIDANINLLIVPDAGTNNTNQCKILKQNNIDCLVLDHHEIEQENPYAIVINHHLGNGLNTALSGTGVAHKFAISCAESWGICLGNLYYDLVATSIISDVCNLTTLENRAYIKYGFEHITDPMLELMFSKFNRKGNNPIGVSWGTAPPINSLCRGDDQQAKMDFFMALIGKGDMDAGVSIVRKAHNEQTKIVKTFYNEIESNLSHDHKVVIGYVSEDCKAYSGLIANKILGNFGKPSLVLRELNSTTWTGSLRSPIPIANEINQSKLALCQGHNAACGITVKKSNLNRLIKWFDALPLDTDPERQVAAILKPNQITLPLCHACCDDMVLWGASEGSKIVQPKFYLEFETSPSDVQVFVKKTTTLKIIKNNVAFLKFQASQGEVDKLTKSKAKVSMVVTLGVNEWNDEEFPQATIDKLEIVEYNDVQEDDWKDWF